MQGHPRMKNHPRNHPNADKNPTNRQETIRTEGNAKSRSHGNRACCGKPNSGISAARPLYLFLLFLRLRRSRGFRRARLLDNHNIFQPHVIAIHDNVGSDLVFRRK